MLDFEALFRTTVVCGRTCVFAIVVAPPAHPAAVVASHVLRHYDQITLVAMDLRRFVKRLRTEKHSKTLFVTHSSRLDIVLGFVSHARVHEGLWGEPFRYVDASRLEGEGGGG